MADSVEEPVAESERWRNLATVGTAACGVVVGVVLVLMFTSCFDTCPSSALVALLWVNLAVMCASVFLSAFARLQRALLWIMGTAQLVTTIALSLAIGDDFASENLFAIVPMLLCQTLAPLAWGQRLLTAVFAVASVAILVALWVAH